MTLALTLHFFRWMGCRTRIMGGPSRLPVHGDADLHIDRPSVENSLVATSIRVGHPSGHKRGAAPETLGNRVCLFAAHAGLGHNPERAAC
jgi:hypothetical protein